MKILIITEKESAARSISHALGGFRQHREYFESPEYYLTWARGHLVVLKEPEDYHRSWRKWSLAQLPIQPVFELKPQKGAGGRLACISRLAQKATGLINACDAGREGELIFRYIVDFLQLHQLPHQRLWLSALTPATIRQAFNGLQEGGDYDTLYQAAACRSEGDWLVGINGTRAMTCRFGELLTVGRVQTPTLALLVEREKAIEQFKPRPFWRLAASFRTEEETIYTGQWLTQKDEEERSFITGEVERVAQEIEGARGAVIEARDRVVTEATPLLFDLTSCQREANRKLGLTAATTLRTLQKLYEKRLVSYPRTDSRYLPRSVAPETDRILQSLREDPIFGQFIDQAPRRRISPDNRRVFHDGNVTDHHGLIPTGENGHGLRGNDLAIYRLITCRFIAQLYPAARFSEQRLITEVRGHRFITRHRTLIAAGWKTIEATRDRIGPANEKIDVSKGQNVKVTATEISSDETKPPGRYTEGTLLGAMERAGKELEEDQLREAMRGRGLGTAATRAAIIERLKEVDYVTAVGKHLQPTAKALRLLELLGQVEADPLRQPELTAHWEWRIHRIERGDESPQAFRRDVRDFTEELMERIREAKVDSERGSVGACPSCHSPVESARQGWHCTRDDCPVTIPAFLLQRRLKESEVMALINQGKTALLSGFTSKNGRKFSAKLFWDDGIKFEFVQRKRSRRRSRT